MTTEDHTQVHLGIKERRCLIEDRVADYLLNEGLSLVEFIKDYEYM